MVFGKRSQEEIDGGAAVVTFIIRQRGNQPVFDFEAPVW